MSSLGLLETAASPKNFLILCSDMNLGLKMEKVQQGSFLFIFMLYHFEYLFFFWGGEGVVGSDAVGAGSPCGGCMSRCGSRTVEATDGKESATVWETECFMA